MREIKFRAFDKNINKMVNVLMIWPGGETCGLQYIDGNNITLTTTIAKEHVSIMQFTGLKDYKGQDIYEGDVVKNSFFHKPLQVIWDNDCAAFKLAQDEYYMGFLASSKKGELQIIGNIYQNPELLKP